MSIGIQQHFIKPKMPGRFIKMYGYLQDSTRMQSRDGQRKNGYLNIKYLIGHIWEESLTRNYLLVLLSWVQLVSRSKTPYLKEVTCNRDYAPPTWLSGIQIYLQYSH
eukprot:3589188-Ditylum_brightwellii.AAC.1